MRYIFLLLVCLNGNNNLLAQVSGNNSHPARIDTSTVNAYIAETDSNHIYIGHVTRETADTYLKIALQDYGSFFQTGIEKSPYPIEVRVYPSGNHYSAGDYTVIYLDTVFKLKSVINVYTDDGKKLQPKERHHPDAEAATTFKILIENGIFSIPALDNEALLAEFTPLFLTQQGLKKAYIVKDISRSVEYIITWKVGRFFGQYLFKDPGVFNRAYPDNPTFKRQAEIVYALLRL